MGAKTESSFRKELELDDIPSGIIYGGIKMAKAKKDSQQTEDENFNYIVRIVNTDIDGQKRTVIRALRESERGSHRSLPRRQRSIPQ